MSRIIKCQVNDEYLLGSGVVIGAAGSHGDVILQLQFNDMWEGLSIMATFRDAMNENPVAIMLMPSMLVIGETRTYEVHVPAEAKRIAGRARLTLSGYSVYTINDDGAITPNVDSLTNTATAFFRVLESDSTIADDGSITPTIAQQLHAEIKNLDEAIDHLGNRLDEAVDDTLITQYTLEPTEAIEEIKKGYTNSFGVSYFNRPPVEGDIFYCLGRTTVEHIPFAMTARITGFSAEGENAVFEAIEVVPLVPANISTGKGANSIVAPGCTADGEKSVALGNGSHAGCRGYYISGVNRLERAIYLSTIINASESSQCDYDADFISGYEVSEKIIEFVAVIYLSDENRKHRNINCQIIRVDGNKITFKDDLPEEFDDIQYSSGKSPYFYIPSQPHPSDNAVPLEGNYSFAVGDGCIASGTDANAEGYKTIAGGNHSHAEGVETYAAWGSHAEGVYSKAMGNYSHAEGLNTYTERDSSHAEGQDTKARGGMSHAEGNASVANGEGAHAEGNSTVAEGKYSHSEGQFTYAKGDFSHAEGCGGSRPAQELERGARANYAHSEGYATTASGDNGSHAEGYVTVASGKDAHAEGNYTVAFGSHSHAEGDRTNATGNFSHAEGSNTTASGQASHAAGIGTIASGVGQTVVGTYNAEDPNALFIVGNGTGPSDSDRKNAFVVKNDGSVYVNGVKVWPNT